MSLYSVLHSVCSRGDLFHVHARFDCITCYMPFISIMMMKTFDTEISGFTFKVDDGREEEETNMRNGGDRGGFRYL